MSDLKKFPVKLAVEQEGGKFYVYGSHIVNFDEITDKIDETNTLLTTANASLVDANGHLVDINGNLVEIDGELVNINTVEGSVADSAVTAGSSGTISGKLRQISADVSTVKTNTTGVSTAANQATANTTLSTIATNTSGVSTAANQATANTTLSTIATNTTGVSTAANQATANTTLSTIATNTSGVSTAANQATANTTLSTIATNTSGVSTAANQTNGTQQSKLTDGTNVANVLKSDGTAAGQNAQLVAGTSLSVPFTTTTVQAVGTTDAANYRFVSVQINSQGANSVVFFQTSNDGLNWTQQALQLASSSTGSGTISSTTGAGGMIASGSISGRYFRLNVTGITTGTTAGIIVFSSNPSSPNAQGVAASQAGIWNTGLAASATGGYTYAHVAPGQDTTVIKASAGTLHSITFGGAAAATNVTTLYDNATGVGTVIGIPDATAITGPRTVIYDLAFTAGLTIITSVANGADMTITYK